MRSWVLKDRHCGGAQISVVLALCVVLVVDSMDIKITIIFAHRLNMQILRLQNKTISLAASVDRTQYLQIPHSAFDRSELQSGALPSELKLLSAR